MSGTWYANLQDQLEAERRVSDPRIITAEDELDWESTLLELAADGDVAALDALRDQLLPIDYDELGWGD